MTILLLLLVVVRMSPGGAASPATISIVIPDSHGVVLPSVSISASVGGAAVFQATPPAIRTTSFTVSAVFSVSPGVPDERSTLQDAASSVSSTSTSLSASPPNADSGGTPESNTRASSAPPLPAASLSNANVVTTTRMTQVFSISVSTSPSLSPPTTPLATLDTTKVSSTSAPSPLSTAAQNISVFPASSSSSASNFPETTTALSHSPGIKIGGIVGIVLGGVALLTLLTVGLLMWWRKRRPAGTFDTRPHASGSELAQEHLFPYMVQTFLTPGPRGAVSRKEKKPVQYSQDARSFDEQALIRSGSAQASHPSPEITHESNVPHFQGSTGSEDLLEVSRSTSPDPQPTHVMAIPSAKMSYNSPQLSFTQPLPRSPLSIPATEPHRHTDGGVRLAGGIPGEIYEDLEEDEADSSSLPPEYGHY